MTVQGNELDGRDKKKKWGKMVKSDALSRVILYEDLERTLFKLQA